MLEVHQSARRLATHQRLSEREWHPAAEWERIVSGGHELCRMQPFASDIGHDLPSRKTRLSSRRLQSCNLAPFLQRVTVLDPNRWVEGVCGRALACKVRRLASTGASRARSARVITSSFRGHRRTRGTSKMQPNAISPPIGLQNQIRPSAAVFLHRSKDSPQRLPPARPLWVRLRYRLAADLQRRNCRLSYLPGCLECVLQSTDFCLERSGRGRLLLLGPFGPCQPTA